MPDRILAADRIEAAINSIVRNEAPLVRLRLNHRNIIIDANPYACQLIGKDLIGTALERIFIDFHSQASSFDLRAQVDAASPTGFHLSTPTGLPVRLMFRFVAARPGEVEALGWHDMGEAIRLQEQLIELNNEVGRITRTTFKDYQFQMDRQAEAYRRIFEAAAEGICGLDADGRHTLVNPAALSMLGYGMDELIGRPSRGNWYSYRGDGIRNPESECRICETLARGVPHANESSYFRRKDGSLFEVTFTSWPIMERRQLVGAVVTFRDITQRRLAEAEVRRSNAELEKQARVIARSNEETRRFAEVTAHHLQEPTRRIATYAERLAAQLEGRLDDAEARLSLEFIGKQAQRLHSLLRDVERYLACDQPEGAMESVDARKTVDKILVRWKNRIDTAGAQITLGSLPACRIDAPRLDDIFMEALDNALCHASGEHPLRIAIEGERAQGKVRYSISDNGPGMEEQYREKVFQVFDQLALSESGTGIGLAILRRIAESCGGRAWIEEAPGGGCRLLLELAAGDPGH